MTLFLTAILLGILLRFLLRRRLVFPRIAFPWLFFLALGWEVLWALLAFFRVAPPEVAGPAGQMGTYLLLGLAFAVNLHEPGFLLAALGALLNGAAIFLNGGHMPVSPAAMERAGLGHLIPFLEEARDGLHVLMDEGTRLSFLGDWIPLPGKVVSPGDVLLVLALFALAAFPRGEGAKAGGGRA